MLSQKTLDEMQAGARTLAQHQGRAAGGVDPVALVAGIRSVQERHAALKRWEREGLLTIEYQSTTDHSRNGLKHTILHHVKNGPTLTETPEALLCGGYPSELLTAQIALAISSCSGGGDG